jgi:hypothetical protein
MVVFALTYVLEILALLYEDFRMNSYSVGNPWAVVRKFPHELVYIVLTGYAPEMGKLLSKNNFR